MYANYPHTFVIDTALLNMSLMKWLKAGDKRSSGSRNRRGGTEDDEYGRGEEDETDEREAARGNQDGTNNETTKLIYFVCDTPKDNVINILNTVDKDIKVSLILILFLKYIYIYNN